MGWSNTRKILGCFALAVLVVYGVGLGLTGSPGLSAPAYGQTSGNVPGNTLGNSGDAELWRAVRKGVTGTVSIPDKKAGTLVQSQGDNWRAFRNGPLVTYGGWLLFAVLLVLVAFFVIRGRITVDGGLSGRTIERFNGLERFTHWLTASSFIVLALTGLNVMYGKYILIPIIGKSAFAALTYYGKLTHNYISFAFIIGIVMMFVIWVRENLPDRYDWQWLIKGGGLFMKNVHPPAKKFNFGQKVVFWAVVLLGGSLAVSGLALLFPFQILPWSPTFALLNSFGFDLPTHLTPLQETQLSVLWHGVLALVLIAVILGHIYIGSLGMEGAFDAVSTGQVDENWAREHHSAWVEEIQAPPEGGTSRQPAE